MWWYIFERTEMKVEVCCLREHCGSDRGVRDVTVYLLM